MEITQEMITEASKQFDGTCPFFQGGGECSWMSIEECNKCKANEGVKND